MGGTRVGNSLSSFRAKRYPGQLPGGIQPLPHRRFQNQPAQADPQTGRPRDLYPAGNRRAILAYSEGHLLRLGGEQTRIQILEDENEPRFS